MRRLSALLVLCLVAGSCGSEPEASSAESTSTTEAEDAADLLYPDVIDVVASEQNNGWRFDVTISSPYDSPAQYADAWRVLAPDGTELGVRILTHDHASEQPFTRSQSGIQIPGDIERVTVEGRDLVNGWGGETLELQLDR
jgi:hypothetical protein